MHGHITTVNSNIKGGVKITDLEPCTAIIAPNRSGKTAVLDAIMLAVLGYHPSLGNVKKKLKRLGDNPWATVNTNDGGASFLLKGDKATHDLMGSWTMLKDRETACLPNVALGDFTTLSENKMREAILRRWGTWSSAAVPPPAGIAEVQAALWREHAKNAPLEDLPSVFRKLKLSESKRAKAVAIISDLNGKTAESVELQAATEKARLDEPKRELAIELKKQSEFAAYTDALAAVERKIQDLQSKVKKPEEVATSKVKFLKRKEDLEASLARLQARARQAAEELEGYRLGQRGLEVIASAEEAAGDPKEKIACYACGEEKERGTITSACRSTAQGFRGMVEDFERDLRACRSSMESTSRELSQLEAQLLALTQQEDMRAELKRAQAESVSLRAKTAPIVDQVKIQNLKAEIAKVGAVAAKLSSEADLLRRAATGHEAAIQSAQLQEAAVVLEGLASSMMEEKIRSVAAVASQAVQAFMPEGFEVQLELVEDGDPACLWSMKGVDGAFHPTGAMCGAERAVWLVAMAQAWSAESPMRILLLDDPIFAPMDDISAHLLLSRCSELVHDGKLTQVIVCSTDAKKIPGGLYQMRKDVR